MALKHNTIAPDFTAPSTSGEDFILSKISEPIVLYFYPKDFTPGCTNEACSFRDNFSFFKDLNIKVLGISMDTVNQHIKFKKEHKLPFELLSDVTGNVCKSYDALIPLIKVPKRITYLIDQNKVIRGVYDNLFGSSDHITKTIETIKKELQE